MRRAPADTAGCLGAEKTFTSGCRLESSLVTPRAKLHRSQGGGFEAEEWGGRAGPGGAGRRQLSLPRASTARVQPRVLAVSDANLAAARICQRNLTPPAPRAAVEMGLRGETHTPPLGPPPSSLPCLGLRTSAHFGHALRLAHAWTASGVLPAAPRRVRVGTRSRGARRGHLPTVQTLVAAVPAVEHADGGHCGPGPAAGDCAVGQRGTTHRPCEVYPRARVVMRCAYVEATRPNTY